MLGLLPGAFDHDEAVGDGVQAYDVELDAHGTRGSGGDRAVVAGVLRALDD
jgi:hypothetical protein